MHDYSTFIWKRLSIIRKNGYETMLIKIWWHWIRDRQIQNIELQDRGWKVLWGRGGIEKQWEMGSLSPNGKLLHHTKSILSGQDLNMNGKIYIFSKTFRVMSWECVSNCEIEKDF